MSGDNSFDRDQTLPVWLVTAESERGVSTFPPGQSNPRIGDYHAHTALRGYDDKASWCSSFVNWVFAQVGIQGTGSALARSWLDWGLPLEHPVPGCVVVLYRDDPASWKGHGSFYLRTECDQVFLFGGNQLDAVREHSYPPNTAPAYRWPHESNADKASSQQL